jgi:DNA-binding response OmpR family regulator/signal transduction histidine kinase
VERLTRGSREAERTHELMFEPQAGFRSPIQILIAEDSRTQAQQLQEHLLARGYRVTVARNGNDALTLALESKPALVITDVVMPGMDGFTLCKAIKSKPALKDVPVIVLTSLAGPQDVLRGLESGADNFIRKPYDEKYLLSRVDYILTNQELRRNERFQVGIELFFRGQKYFITAEKQQILDLLISTYEGAVQINEELETKHKELARLTDDLEGRVVQRTQQLQEANQSLRHEIAERKEAEGKLHVQLSRLDLLHRITRAVGERQDLHSIFQIVLQSLEEHLSLDFGCVGLCDAQAAVITLASIRVQSAARASEVAVAESECITIEEDGLARCLKGQLVYEPDISLVDASFARRLARGGLRALVAVPLLVESKVFGVLIAARYQAHSFSSTDCEFLRQLSEHVALAAHQAQLHETLQHAYQDLRQSQATMMQQERLSALGQMASGIAHDINNSISPIALYTESLLKKETGLSDRAQAYLTTIQRAIEDVAQTVSRMREFYRPRERQTNAKPVDINQLIVQVLELTRFRWKDVPEESGMVLHLQTELSPELPVIMGVEAEIRDALTNLIFNAVDAMPNGGTLRACAHGVAAPAGARVYVEIGDTGTGMDEETRRRCLEPFFTTKGERGTGLGLAMVYGMAQRHGADMEIESQPGRGTTARLVFPVVGPVKSSPAQKAPLAPKQHLRILIVDDDPVLIKSLRDTLEADGHWVTPANGGQAGIDAFTEAQLCGESFAMVITDLGMPHVDGRKVAAAVKAVSPGTPVILLTGWGQNLSDTREIPQHVDRLLNKPPRLRELQATFAELMVAPFQANCPDPDL